MQYVQSVSAITVGPCDPSVCCVFASEEGRAEECSLRAIPVCTGCSGGAKLVPGPCGECVCVVRACVVRACVRGFGALTLDTG